MKIVISGGHFSPALAVIEELQSRNINVLVVGRKHAFEGDSAYSFEYLVCRDKKIPFQGINAGRLQRTFTIETFPALFKIPLGFVQALGILLKYKPDIALVFGGYLALPVAYGARLLKIPIFVHEQTTQASFANKHIAYFAQRIFITFESSQNFFSESVQDKIQFTGNPVRKEIFESKDKFNIPPGFKVIYVTGGNSGSHFVNMLISRIIDKLLEKAVVIHQTGNSNKSEDYNNLQKIRDSLSTEKRKRYFVREFVYPSEIGWVLKTADLVISRAGINSIYEYLLLGKPSMLIPLSHGQKNEQLENARFVQDTLYAGKFMEQDKIDDATFLNEVIAMLSDLQKFKKNLSEAFRFVRKDAGKIIADELQFFNAKNARKEEK